METHRLKSVPLDPNRLYSSSELGVERSGRCRDHAALPVAALIYNPAMTTVTPTHQAGLLAVVAPITTLYTMHGPGGDLGVAADRSRCRRTNRPWKRLNWPGTAGKGSRACLTRRMSTR